MRRIKRQPLFVLYIFFALVCGGGCASDQSHTPTLNALLESERQRYAALHPNWGGGMALYIKTPAGAHFAQAGFTPQDVVSEATHFRAASTTKTFTAASVMWLHQRGLLDIEDKVTDTIPGKAIPYLPNTPAYAFPYKNQITIRQLLAHRGGIFDISNEVIPGFYAGKLYMNYVREDLGDDTHTFTFDEIMGVVSLHQLYKYPPDQQFSYSNGGYVLLGVIIERVSGQRWHEFVTEKFTTPLGLAETSFPYLGTDQQIPSPYFPGFYWFQNALYPATTDNVSGNVAEGNAISSLSNLATWVRTLLRGEAGLSPATVAQMMVCPPTGESHRFYGLGINYTPGLGYGHNGGHIGYITVMRYDPSYDITTVLVVCNMNGEDVNGQLLWQYNIIGKGRNILGYPGLL